MPVRHLTSMSNSTSAPPATTSQAISALITSGWHLRVEDSMALVSVTLLFYDYFLTFGDEVEFIWRRPKKSLTSVLYLTNRYFTPAACVICMIALFSPNWTLKSCDSFSKFEGLMTLVTVMIAEALLVLRVCTVFGNDRRVLVFQCTLWVIQLCFMSFTLAHSGPVIIPPSPITYGCILVADPKIGGLSIFFVVPSLVFDTSTIVLLLAGLIRRARFNKHSPILKLLARDGILYFALVFASNTAWTVTGLTLATDMKNILSFFSTIITNILIGRLTLNLRAVGGQEQVAEKYKPTGELHALRDQDQGLDSMPGSTQLQGSSAV